jgi:predicted nucleic acid-binding protein
VADFCDRLRGAARLITDVPALTSIVRDPHVIATAGQAQAIHIVTRDDDLLALQPYQGLTITTLEAFMALWRAQGLVSS